VPSGGGGGTQIGSCTGQVGLVTFYNSAKVAAPLTDVTQIGVTAKTKLLKDLNTKATIGGTCVAPPRTGDPNIPAPGGPVTPKAVSASLVGNASCAAPADDPNAAAAWPLNGKMTFTMNEKYTDLVSAKLKPYSIQTDISLLGPGASPDVVNIGGIVLKGLAVGATVSGSIWQDPVAKTGGTSGYNTGYELDLAAGLGCADSTPNNASVATTMFGGGDGSSTSLIGGTAEGVKFTLGE